MLFGLLVRSLLSKGLGVRFQAHGRSMQPTIQDGEILHVKPVSAKNLRRGDIVLFAERMNYKAHRLISVDLNHGVFMTRGDAGTESDGVLQAEQILGRVVAKEENSEGRTRVVRLGGKPARIRLLARGMRSRTGRLVRTLLNLRCRGVRGRIFGEPKIEIGSNLVFLLSLLFWSSIVCGQVAFDSATSVGQHVAAGTTSVSLPHTTAAGSNRVLVVGISMNIANNTGATVSGVSYNGVALTLAGAHNDGGLTRRVEIWYLVAPASGLNNVIATVNLPGGTGILGVVVGAATFTGADQTIPIRSFLSADAAAGSLASLNLPSAYGDMVVDTLATGGDRTVTTFGPSQTAQWNLTSTAAISPPDVRGTGSTRAGAPSVPLSEQFSATSNWSAAAVSIQPLQADLAVSVVGSSAFFPNNLSYTITVTDRGPSVANGVTLTDTLPAGLTYVSATPSQGSCSFTAPTVTCNLLNLNGVATVTLVATPSAIGGYPDTASVTSSVTDLNAGNNSSTGTAFSQSNTCATPAKNGAGGTLSTVINTYYPPSGNVALPAGVTSVTLGTSRGSASTIAIGDLLLFIQMQDAAIDSTNTTSYGDGATGTGSTNLNNSGKYEFATATSNVPAAGGSLTFSASGPGGGLLFAYTQAAATATQGQRSFQVVRVPQYSSATLGYTAATSAATAWNGSTGGIFAIDVSGILTLNSATVSVDGVGFRGGAALQLSGTAGRTNTDYRSAAPTAYTGAAVAGAHGAKGEGIAGTPRWVESGVTFLDTTVEGYPNGSMAKGAPGNAGGGGTDANPTSNDQNAGGAGGGNGGVGGTGGNAWNANLSSGGLGGAVFPASLSQVVMGGGGGAGSRNNSNNDNRASSGAAGGGIVLIRAGNLSGTATISANGAAAYNGTANDAGGGGGAGGSVIVLSASGGEGGLAISAHGGNGGNAWATQAFSIADRHGPGGGGGGGAVLVSGPAASINVTGGASGLTLNPGVPYGATGGGAGISTTNAALSLTPGSQSGAQCTPDMTITKSHSPVNFVQGSTGTYTLTAKNSSVGTSASTTAAVTVTDTLPAGLTPTSATGTGWGPGANACSVVLQTVTCTRSNVLAPGASYPPITINVLVSFLAPPSVTNTATVAGGGEANTANDTATDVANVLPLVDADVAITKAASPNPVLQGNALTYTLGVMNNGPAIATNVTVTDTLPSQVSYVSAISSQGTCSQASGTVTCSVGAMASGATATITITVTAVTRGSVTNTASVTATQTDPVMGNNSASNNPPTLIVSPTRVELKSFTAAISGAGISLAWKTGGEERNLGFNVYREENGNHVRLNPSLIAGSALWIRGGLEQHSAKTYGWIDRSAGVGVRFYWLEDVDLQGTRTLHGPVSPTPDAVAPSPQRAQLITELNPSTTEQTPEFLSGAPRTRVTRRSNDGMANKRDTQFKLAGHPAVKLLVRREGWYRVTQPELVAAGLDNSADPKFLALFAEGREQSIRVAGATDGTGGFGPKGSIEFYATGIDTPYSDTRVYWLVAGNQPGKRVAQQAAFETGSQEPSSFPYTIELKPRTTYFAAFLKKNTDNFFGALVSSAPVDEVLTVRNLAAASAEDIRLAIVLQGITDGALHNVRVNLNGATLGDLNFVGQDGGKITFDVPRELVQEGANIVTLTAQAGENDLSLVDTIRLEFPHTYTAESDSLMFTAESGERVKIDGFARPPKRLIDITNSTDPVELTPEVHTKDGQFELEVSVPWTGPEKHLMLAVAEEQIAHPSEVVRNHPSRWHGAHPGYEVLMVTSDQFASQLAPLLQLRRSQGKSAAIISIDDLYDEFNFGERSPHAIRQFLKIATERWQEKPKSLLLVGDASVDPRNYLGFGSFDFVPTKIIVTSELKTASDDWFSDFGNIGLGKIPTGRLPVRTAEQAKTVVAKILAYEREGERRGNDNKDWINQALLVADRDDTVDFTKDTKSIEALLPKAMKATTVFAGNLDANTARQEIVASINSGKLLVNYLGHGSVEIWSGEDLLDNTAASALSNGTRLPVFLIMDCLNGFFHDVYTESLAESLLLAKNGGAVAVWASSGLTEPEPQAEMDQNLVRLLFTGPSVTLGEAIRNAKAKITDSDARRTYILFGDPMLRLRGPRPVLAGNSRGK
jgi:uncharacterized repeat protein (TIGR01451 family)